MAQRRRSDPPARARWLVAFIALLWGLLEAADALIQGSALRAALWGTGATALFVLVYINENLKGTGGK